MKDPDLTESSLRQEKNKNTSKNCFLQGESNDIFPAYKSVLPLIDDDDMPYNIYGRFMSEREPFGEKSKLTYHNKMTTGQLDNSVPESPPIDIEADPDGYNSPTKHWLKCLPNVAESGKEIADAKKAVDKKSVKFRQRKEKKSCRSVSAPTPTKRNAKSSYKKHRSYQDPDQVPILTTLPVTAATPLFEIDDVIEGTSDTVRELFQTSDAIDNVLKNADDDIEKALECSRDVEGNL